MSLKAMLKVFETNIPDPLAKLIALAYADYASKDGTSIYPAVGSIVDMTSISRRTVQRKTGLIVFNKFMVADGTGPQGTNKYYIDMAWDRLWIEHLTGGASVTPRQADTGGVPPVQVGGVTLAALLGVTGTPNPLTVIDPLIKDIDIWVLAKENLRQSMAHETYNKWVAPTILAGVSFEQEFFFINATDQYSADWLKARLTDPVSSLIDRTPIFTTPEQMDAVFIEQLQAKQNE